MKHVRPWFLAMFASLLGLAAWPLAADQTNVFCLVCSQGPLKGRVWIHSRGHVCQTCYTNYTRCNLCGIPARDQALRTTDGRTFCQWDAPNLVLTMEQARQVYEDMLAALDRQYGKLLNLRQPNVNLSLFDVDYWNRADSPKLDAMHQTGFSHSRPVEGRQVHSILLYSGLPRAATAATVLHELTHLWLHENTLADRKIDPDTKEAICELVAYKIMEARGETNQMAQIRKNLYTRGQINTLIASESRFGLPLILNWAAQGTGTTLPENLQTTEKPTTPPVVLGTPEPPTYQNLRLQSILGSETRRIAAINDQWFSPGDEKTLKVAGRYLKVRCETIAGRTVRLLVDGAEKPVVLTLD